MDNDHEQREQVAAPPDAGGYVLFEPEDRLTPEDRNLPLVVPPAPHIRGGITAADTWGVPIKRLSHRQAPRRLYMVYMKFDAAGGLVVRQMERGFLAAENIDQAEARLFQALHAGGYDHKNFEDMSWKTPCQLTFVVDNPGWSFYFRNHERHGPVRFFRRKDNLSTGSKIYGRNFAFFDATPVAVARRNGFRCSNFVEDEAGRLPGGRTIDYCFQIYLETPFSVPGTQRHITVLIDPDGQNQGPGV